jgi:ABC-type Fe3+-hydroxamate transport system substrate-binding protein
MKANRRTFQTLSMLMALLALTACNSTPSPTGHEKVETSAQVFGSAGFGGETIVNTVATNGTVIVHDTAKRLLTIKFPDGQTRTYTAEPGAYKFDQIKVGDVIHGTVVDERAVSVVPAGTQLTEGESASVTQDPNGSLKLIRKVNFTSKIVALDPLGGQVTLQMADSEKKTIRVGDTVNLADFNVGQDVSVRITETTTLAL